jgi:hypothetical protein
LKKGSVRLDAQVDEGPFIEIGLGIRLKQGGMLRASFDEVHLNRRDVLKRLSAGFALVPSQESRVRELPTSKARIGSFPPVSQRWNPQSFRRTALPGMPVE